MLSIQNVAGFPPWSCQRAHDTSLGMGFAHHAQSQVEVVSPMCAHPVRQDRMDSRIVSVDRHVPVMGRM